MPPEMGHVYVTDSKIKLTGIDLDNGKKISMRYGDVTRGHRSIVYDGTAVFSIPQNLSASPMQAICFGFYDEKDREIYLPSYGTHGVVNFLWQARRLAEYRESQIIEQINSKRSELDRIRNAYNPRDELIHKKVLFADGTCHKPDLGPIPQKACAPGEEYRVSRYMCTKMINICAFKSVSTGVLADVAVEALERSEAHEWAAIARVFGFFASSFVETNCYEDIARETGVPYDWNSRFLGSLWENAQSSMISAFVSYSAKILVEEFKDNSISGLIDIGAGLAVSVGEYGLEFEEKLRSCVVPFQRYCSIAYTDYRNEPDVLLNRCHEYLKNSKTESKIVVKLNNEIKKLEQDLDELRDGIAYIKQQSWTEVAVSCANPALRRRR